MTTPATRIPPRISPPPLWVWGLVFVSSYIVEYVWPTTIRVETAPPFDGWTFQPMSPVWLWRTNAAEAVGVCALILIVVYGVRAKTWPPPWRWFLSGVVLLSFTTGAVRTAVASLFGGDIALALWSNRGLGLLGPAGIPLALSWLITPGYLAIGAGEARGRVKHLMTTFLGRLRKRPGVTDVHAPRTSPEAATATAHPRQEDFATFEAYEDARGRWLLRALSEHQSVASHRSLRRDVWIGVAVLVVLAVMYLAFPRYEYRSGPSGSVIIQIDRWTGETALVRPSPIR